MARYYIFPITCFTMVCIQIMNPQAKLWIWLFKSYIRGQLSFIFKCLSVWNEWVPRNCPLNKLILWDKTSFVFMIGLFSGPILWAWTLLICVEHKYDIFYTHSQQLWVVAAQPSVKNTKTFSKYKKRVILITLYSKLSIKLQKKYTSIGCFNLK